MTRSLEISSNLSAGPEQRSAISLSSAFAEGQIHKTHRANVRVVRSAPGVLPWGGGGSDLDEFLPPPGYSRQQCQCGVGIGFQDDIGGNIFVSSLAARGPAFRCRQIQVGDVLVRINGADITSKSAQELGPFLVGPAGSEVLLQFRRRRGTAWNYNEFTVHLIREWVLPPRSLAQAQVTSSSATSEV